MSSNKKSVWKIAKPLLLLSILLALLLLLGSLLLPSSYQVQRSTFISAPIETVFSHVNTTKLRSHWSPWKQHDQSMSFHYNEIRQGEGAVYYWKSESCGEGAVTITKSIPNQSLSTKIIFNHGEASFGKWTFIQQDSLVKTTWSISGDVGYNPIGRYIAFFVDNMVGPRFEEGLETLKQICETKSQQEQHDP